MAKRADAVADNVAGDLFVDAACIHCGTCYHLVPEIFRDAGPTSAVHHQPTTADLRHRAHQALVACPTAAIGSSDVAATRAAAASFPLRVTERVWFNGFTQRDAFGAWSYLVQAADGNVLVDSPRPVRRWREAVDELGGVQRIVLSHRDDIAGHDQHAAYWQAPRIAHAREAIDGVEQPVAGDEPVALANDLLLIPTPGHTAGSVCLLFEERVLFTGDHLWWNPVHRGLSASPTYCWHDWSAQLASLERLLAFPFTWVCPGHGAMHQAASVTAMHGELRRALDRLHTLDG